MNFVRVKEVPTELRKDEYVIPAVTFLDEVKACFKKRPHTGVMSVNYLRELIAAVGMKYLPEDFNPLTDVNVSNFKGTPCTSEGETNEVLLKLFKQQYPAALDAFVEYHVKRRPNGTRVIYFLGDNTQTRVFIKHGIQEILLKDLYKEEKPKKTVGKPAITKEEAEKKSETVV